MKCFIDNKLSFAEIIPYGFLDLIRNYISLLSLENFLDNPNLHIPLENSSINENNFSSSFRNPKLSMNLIEKTSQKLSLISLVLHALDGLLEFEIPFEKKNFGMFENKIKSEIFLENIEKNELNEKNAEKNSEKSDKEKINENKSEENEKHDKNHLNEKEKTNKNSQNSLPEPEGEKLLEKLLPIEKSHHENLDLAEKSNKLLPYDSSEKSSKKLLSEEKKLNESALEQLNLKLIYASNKEKKGFSDYINLNNNLNSSRSAIIYLCFDSLYEVLETLIQMITPLNQKEIVACYCSMAEVTRNISKILAVMKDVEFEQITKVLNSLANVCIYKSLENYIVNYPIFDYLIEACYLIHERFKFSVEKQIGLIIESLLKEKGFFNTVLLKKHIYLYFLNTVSKLNFKKIGWDLKNSLNDLIEILVMGLSRFPDSIYAYYMLIIIKQIILHYDIKTFPALFESLTKLFTYILDFLKKFNEKIHRKEPENNDSVIEIEEISKYVLIFCFENLLLLIYFQEFHKMFISLELFPVSLGIGSYMLNLLNDILSENTQKLIIFKHKEEEILNILKLIIMTLNHATYYMIFHEQLANEEMLSFLLELLISNIKQLQLISFNSIINLIEANGLILVKRVLEISLHKIEEINQLLIQKKNEKKVNLEPFLSILEHIYFSKDLFLSSDNEEENLEIKHFIGLLVTNVIIEKHELKLSKKILDIVFKEANLSIEIEARLLMIMLKIIYFSEGLIIDLRDTVLEFFKNSLKKKQEMFKINESFASKLALISIPTIKKFVNSDIRTFKDAISLENVFFWEYCSDQHT